MRNQCDGCQAGLPVNERGHHISPKGPWDGMVCQKDKYKDVVETDDNEPGEGDEREHA